MTEMRFKHLVGLNRLWGKRNVGDFYFDPMDGEQNSENEFIAISLNIFIFISFVNGLESSFTRSTLVVCLHKVVRGDDYFVLSCPVCLHKARARELLSSSWSSSLKARLAYIPRSMWFVQKYGYGPYFNISRLDIFMNCISL